MKIFCIVCVMLISTLSESAWAQYSAQKEAMYMATLKVVTDYKMGDEDNIKELNQLRENKKFNQDLQKMLEKLSNRRTKNSINTKVYRILLQAGKDIYNELN